MVEFITQWVFHLILVEYLIFAGVFTLLNDWQMKKSLSDAKQN